VRLIETITHPAAPRDLSKRETIDPPTSKKRIVDALIAEKGVLIHNLARTAHIMYKSIAAAERYKYHAVALPTADTVHYFVT
jgi:hypothetical protein